MHNLIEYSDKYSKTSGSLWQYYRDVPNANLTYSGSFKSKMKIAGNTPTDGNTKDVKIAVPLKLLSNLWRTLEMPLINCEINLILALSSTWIITNSTSNWRFAITDRKLYIPVETNAKLVKQLKSGFKSTINWNKYQSEPETITK